MTAVTTEVEASALSSTIEGAGGGDDGMGAWAVAGRQALLFLLHRCLATARVFRCPPKKARSFQHACPFAGVVDGCSCVRCVAALGG